MEKSDFQSDKLPKESSFLDSQVESINSSERLRKKEEDWFRPGMVMFYRLSGWIGGPVIVALFVGKKLDEKFSSEPWGFLACVGVAFVLSSVGIVWEAQKAIREIENKDKDNKDKKKGDKDREEKEEEKRG